MTEVTTMGARMAMPRGVWIQLRMLPTRRKMSMDRTVTRAYDNLSVVPVRREARAKSPTV